MGKGIRRIWPGGLPSVSGGRIAREGFVYYAFDGWPIADLAWSFPAELVQDLAGAESRVRRLNEDPPRTQVLEALARQLLRAEAVASSRIEGLELSYRRLAEADFDPGDTTVNARTVLGNVRAMEEAIRLGTAEAPFTITTLQRIHRRLFESTADAHLAGRIRTSQSWIGGRGDSPYKAEFIPVPEEHVLPLLEDLCRFVARDELPALAQAAIAHAQFETIHPFEDGNGRVGRCLIHFVLRRRGLAAHYVPPVSPVLAANYSLYIEGLTAYREHREPEWCGIFARATNLASLGAVRLAVEIEALKARWRVQAGSPRADSAAAKLIDLLPAHPVLDLRSATEFLDVSDEAARLAIARLERAGVLQETTSRKWRRTWECAGLFKLLDTFDRQIATPPGASGPRRAAPRPTARLPRA